MTLSIRCDHVDPDFQQCEAQLSGMAFNAKPGLAGARHGRRGPHGLLP